jgi:hypothetical protein
MPESVIGPRTAARFPIVAYQSEFQAQFPFLEHFPFVLFRTPHDHLKSSDVLGRPPYFFKTGFQFFA